MALFNFIRQHITAREAAEHYGLRITRSGMTCCPFHDDHDPSMKVDNRYFCFACHATGDATDLTAQLFDLTKNQAAEKLIDDFDLDPAGQNEFPAALHRMEALPNTERFCVYVLKDYLSFLEFFEAEYRPRFPGDEWDPRYVEAAKNLPEVNQSLVDLLGSDRAAYERTMNSLLQDGCIYVIEDRVRQLKAGEVVPHAC